MKPVFIHVKDCETGDSFRYQYTYYPPAIGDVIKLYENYYTVVSKTWCLDEESEDYERLNITVTRVNNDN